MYSLIAFYFLLRVKMTEGRNLSHSVWGLPSACTRVSTAQARFLGYEVQFEPDSQRKAVLLEPCCVLFMAADEWHPRTQSSSAAERRKVSDTSSAIGAIGLLNYF